MNLKGGAIAVSCVGGSRVLDFRCYKIPKHFPYTLCAFPLLGLGSRVLDFRCCKLCKCFPYAYQLGNDICVHQLKNGFLISQENTLSSSSSSFSVFVDGYLTWSWSQVPCGLTLVEANAG